MGVKRFDSGWDRSCLFECAFVISWDIMKLVDPLRLMPPYIVTFSEAFSRLDARPGSDAGNLKGVSLVGWIKRSGSTETINNVSVT